jgi:opacity protein-like surface antigen
MKRFLLIALIAMVACTPAQQADVIVPQFPPGSSGKKLEAGIWVVEFDATVKGALIGSSLDITEFTSTAPCEYRTVIAGTRRALVCNAPNTVTLKTLGEIQVRTLEFTPLVPKTLLAKTRALRLQ